MILHERPAPEEYSDFYAGYVDLVDPGPKDILTHLKAQGMVMLALMRSLGEEDGARAYAEGKWTLNELIGHLIDMERVFGFRALWIARGETRDQPGIDEGHWAAHSNAGHRTFLEMHKEQHVCRTNHIYLMRSFCERAWERTGTADGKALSLRAIPWIICGHERHHMQVMKERYGLPVPL
jgi:hypothetical protein